MKSLLRRIKNRVSPRQRKIRAEQWRLLNTMEFDKTRALVFMIPGRDVVNGGVMAICSHALESKKLEDLHHAGVHVCSFPGGPTILKLTKFENSITMVSFCLLSKMMAKDAWIHVNIPEVSVGEFLEGGVPIIRAEKHRRYSFNIMLQNIDFAPSRTQVERLKKFGIVTVTTAHKAYSNAAVECSLGARIWHWSVWVSPEKYRFVDYREKQKLIVYSPDKNPCKEYVLAGLRQGLNDYEFVEINGLTYEEYKELVGRARFSLTFGEGLDGYFVEPIFSGSVACAVFNERFFTSDYRGLPCVYDSWDELVTRLISLVSRSSEEDYKAIQFKQFEVVARNYAYSEYIANLRHYYMDLMLLTKVI